MRPFVRNILLKPPTRAAITDPKILLSCDFSTASQFSDASIYARTATMTGSPSIVATNDPDGALWINNYSGHEEDVEFPYDPAFNFTGKNFSIKFRLMLLQVGVPQTIIAVRNAGGGPTWSIQTNSANKILFGDSASNAYGSATALSLNTWYDVEITRISNAYKTYINGVLDASSSSIGGVFTDRGAPLLIGKWSPSNNSIPPKINIKSVVIRQL